MLHPAPSINPYHTAPTLMMEHTDVPLIDRKTEQNKRRGKERELDSIQGAKKGGRQITVGKKKHLKL